MSISVPVYSNPHNLLAAYGASNPFQSISNNQAKGIISLDNTVQRAVNIRLLLGIKSGATLSGPQSLDLYVAGSLDGLTYSDGYVAANFQNQVVGLPVQSQLVASIPLTAAATEHYWEGEVTAGMGTLPRYLGIVAVNRSGASLDAAFNHQMKASYITYEFV